MKPTSIIIVTLLLMATTEASMVIYSLGKVFCKISSNGFVIFGRTNHSDIRRLGMDKNKLSIKLQKVRFLSGDHVKSESVFNTRSGPHFSIGQDIYQYEDVRGQGRPMNTELNSLGLQLHMNAFAFGQSRILNNGTTTALAVDLGYLKFDLVLEKPRVPCTVCNSIDTVELEVLVQGPGPLKKLSSDGKDLVKVDMGKKSTLWVEKQAVTVAKAKKQVVTKMVTEPFSDAAEVVALVTIPYRGWERVSWGGLVQLGSPENVLADEASQSNDNTPYKTHKAEEIRSEKTTGNSDSSAIKPIVTRLFLMILLFTIFN